MAQVSIRQGIVRTHSNAVQFTTPVDGTPALLSDGLNDPISYTFADGPDTDYLYSEETLVDPAWTGAPTGTNTPYWLFYELDILTGERLFGLTLLEPVAQNRAPSNPQVDQHWFDTRTNFEQMNVWDGSKWQRKIRVFAARVQGLVINQFEEGESQVGFNTPVRAGHLLFDDENKTKPIKRFDRRGRGKFITTETPVFSQFSNLTGFRPEQSIVDAKAVEPIGQYQCVAFRNVTPVGGSPAINVAEGRSMGLARNTDPDFACIGVALEATATGEVRSYVTSGYLTDDNFNILLPNVDFSLDPGTLVFVGDDGQMTTDVPQTSSIQRVAILVDSFTILVSIQPLIIYG